MARVTPTGSRTVPPTCARSAQKLSTINHTRALRRTGRGGIVKNKALRTGAALVALSLAAAGCGFGDDEGEDGDGSTIELLVPSYSDGTQALWESIISDLEKDNPDID